MLNSKELAFGVATGRDRTLHCAGKSNLMWRNAWQSNFPHTFFHLFQAKRWVSLSDIMHSGVDIQAQLGALGSQQDWAARILCCSCVAPPSTCVALLTRVSTREQKDDIFCHFVEANFLFNCLGVAAHAFHICEDGHKRSETNWQTRSLPVPLLSQSWWAAAAHFAVLLPWKPEVRAFQLSYGETKQWSCSLCVQSAANLNFVRWCAVCLGTVRTSPSWCGCERPTGRPQEKLLNFITKVIELDEFVNFFNSLYSDVVLNLRRHPRISFLSFILWTNSRPFNSAAHYKQQSWFVKKTAKSIVCIKQTFSD